MARLAIEENHGSHGKHGRRPAHKHSHPGSSRSELSGISFTVGAEEIPDEPLRVFPDDDE
jgi:hypothetical protein